MDTNFVPVTETEMRDFFQRVVTSIVGYSRQVQDMQEQVGRQNEIINQLRTSIEEMKVRIGSLQEENDRIKDSEAKAWEFARQQEEATKQSEGRRVELEHQLTGFKDALVSRDSRVHELEAALREMTEDRDSQRAAVDQLTSERDNLRQENEQLRVGLTQTHDTLYTVTRERDDYKLKLDHVQSRLDDINSVLGAIRSPQQQEPEQSQPPLHAVG